MKGKYEIVVQDRRLQYKFVLERNITILRGDSATGKTTLIEMIAANQRAGEQSGVSVRAAKPCVVLNQPDYWQAVLSQIHDSFVFIDEGNPFVRSEDFAHAIKHSDNYYVIATRAALFNLPYSVKEIYGIRNTSGNRYQGTKRLYAEFYPLCETGLPAIEKPDLVLVEDSNSGFEFFRDFFSNYHIPCVSAGGKSNLYGELATRDYQNALVIADGAAFGPEVERVLSVRNYRSVMIYLPESFEWIVLKSDLLKDKEVRAVLEQPADFVESADYFSWEQFFTAMLTEKTKDSYLQYQKSTLNGVYLNPAEQAAIQNVLPPLSF